MDIRGKVTHGRLDPTIERTAIGEMAPEAHSSCAYAAIARREREQIVDRETGVLVVGSQFLSASSASISARNINIERNVRSTKKEIQYESEGQKNKKKIKK